MNDEHSESSAPIYTRTRSHPSPSPLTDYRSVYDPLETVQVSEEAPWDQQGEDLLRSWLEAAKQQAATHRKHGFRLKHLYKFYGILAIVSAGTIFLFSI